MLDDACATLIRRCRFCSCCPFLPKASAHAQGCVAGTAQVGSIFREDGVGLRDEYVISGPELETMCDIVRSVPGVLGERMLGGGDKGASGCLVLAGAAEPVAQAVDTAYPRSRPEYADKYATHVVQICDGVTVFDGAL